MEERDEKIVAASTSAKAFHQNMDKMLWWLNNSEEKLKKLSPKSFDKNTVAEKSKELQVNY